jgi:hypothetical protein
MNFIVVQDGTAYTVGVSGAPYIARFTTTNSQGKTPQQQADAYAAYLNALVAGNPTQIASGPPGSPP